MGDKGDKNAARPPEGSLVETRCLIKGPKSAIVPFPGPRSGPKSRTGPGASQKAKSRVRAFYVIPTIVVFIHIKYMIFKHVDNIFKWADSIFLIP